MSPDTKELLPQKTDQSEKEWSVLLVICIEGKNVTANNPNVINLADRS